MNAFQGGPADSRAGAGCQFWQLPSLFSLSSPLSDSRVTWMHQLTDESIWPSVDIKEGVCPFCFMCWELFTNVRNHIPSLQEYGMLKASST